MKRLVAAIFGAGVALLGFTSPVNANTVLTFGDSDSLGSVIPGHPASLTDEAGYINTLVPLSAGAHTVGSYDFGRTSNFEPPTGLPSATAVDGVQTDTPPGSPLGIDVTGYKYLLAKYGDADYVWYVGTLLGLVDLPGLSSPSWDTTLKGHADGHGMSHWALFNPSTPPPPLPDGGATVALLGLGLLGVAALGRRLIHG